MTIGSSIIISDLFLLITGDLINKDDTFIKFYVFFITKQVNLLTDQLILYNNISNIINCEKVDIFSIMLKLITLANLIKHINFINNNLFKLINHIIFILRWNLNIFIYWAFLLLIAIVLFEVLDRVFGGFIKIIKRKFFHFLVILVFIPGLSYIVHIIINIRKLRTSYLSAIQPYIFSYSQKF